MPEEFALRALETLMDTRWETVKRPTPFIMRRVNHYWNLFHGERQELAREIVSSNSALRLPLDAFLIRRGGRRGMGGLEAESTGQRAEAACFIPGCPQTDDPCQRTQDTAITAGEQRTCGTGECRG